MNAIECFRDMRKALEDVRADPDQATFYLTQQCILNNYAFFLALSPNSATPRELVDSIAGMEGFEVCNSIPDSRLINTTGTTQSP